MEKEILTWDKYHELIKEANEKIDFSNIDLIVGLTRGGLTPAVHLSNANDIKMLPLACSFRDAPDIEMYKKDLEIIKKYNNILIVDDIYDSGKTVAKIREDLSEKTLKFYTIYSTDETAVDYYNVVKKTDDWIIFPWEII
jgi:hypoxanthine phosphoribosyltransferase